MNIRLLSHQSVCKVPRRTTLLHYVALVIYQQQLQKKGYQNSVSEKVQLPEEFIIYRSIDEKQYTKGLSMTSLSLSIFLI